MNIEQNVAANLLGELHNLLDKYDGMMMNATMIGVIDLVKAQLLMDSLERIDCDEDDE